MATKLKFRYRSHMLNADHNEEWEANMLIAAERFNRRVGRGADAQEERPNAWHTLWLIMPNGQEMMVDEQQT